MMKYICALIVCLIANYTYSQNLSDTDSLKKYSYFVMGVYKTGRSTIQGTGCFVIKNEDTYFVTALHVLLQCDSLIKKELDAPSLMNIILMNEYGEFNYQFIYLDISKLRDTGICPLPHTSIDVIAFKIHNINNYKLFYINHFNSLIYPKKKVK